MILQDGISLFEGDCLEKMKEIPDGSVDMVLTDPPYGVSACRWDVVIPFPDMWEQINRIIKPNGAVLLFGSEPFSSALRLSNLQEYRYDWIWEKTIASNFRMCKKQPSKKHEIISVFYAKQPTYNPQMEKGKPYKDRARKRTTEVHREKVSTKRPIDNHGTRYPSSVQKFSNKNNGNVHPTQKPVPLLEYLIRTYTDGGETVLDFTMGSGSTGVACINTGRKFIGIELDHGYFETAKQRIEEAIAEKQPSFFDEKGAIHGQ